MSEMRRDSGQTDMPREAADAVVVGAGFAGLYMIYRLRALGLSVRCFEIGGDVGGTWFWNRYPGARCDIESLDYSYSFSDELQQEWEWTEKFATQPEILRYIKHVADRFALRQSIRFETRVTAAFFDDAANRWCVSTDRGDEVSASFLIMATGCLSITTRPDIPGLDSFAGRVFHTGNWPHEQVDFTGRRVGVIGTGSSGIQCIPVLAEQARHVTVFQRTPNFSLPARNSLLDPWDVRKRKADYDAYRQQARESFTGVPVERPTKQALAVDADERHRKYEAAWESGKYGALLRAYTDLMTNKQANDTASGFVRNKIRQIVSDPATAETLAPKSFPFGAKRTCLDTDYYETYNRENVSLVDLIETPISAVGPTGINTTDATYECDDIVFATGFDAMTGAILRVDIRGREGQSIRDKWADGPRTYLGLAVSGFPNLFFITGPGSPSVLSNMIVSIEHHVEWITKCITYLRAHDIASIEATEEAETSWVEHVNEVADQTLYPLASSWYLGANIPGKQRVFMPYVAGVGVYRRKCDDVVRQGYKGFELTRTDHGDSPRVDSQSHA